MSVKRVLVTGASGFIAGHAIEQLLALGYTVRGTARASKIPGLKAANLKNFELFAVDDIATEDITEALKDVESVLHIAAPLPGKTTYDGVLHSVFDGMMNVVRQTEKAGIKKIVVTSSFGSVVPDASMAPAFGGLTFNEDSWTNASRETMATKPGDGFYAYFTLKALAEQELWAFAKSHPNIDITAILPGMTYGPWTKLLPRPVKGGPLGTNTFPWMVLNGRVPPLTPPWVADVRDVARAHILALSLPPSPPGSKRFLINSGIYPWKEAAAHLQKVRPEYTTVAKPESLQDMPGPVSVLDTTRSRDVLGLKETIPLEKTVEDVMDDLWDLQKSWAAAESAASA
ncbi:hypothetical protein D9613_010419 [Agrocybe pediades]|uniref:NAD-dependent epimerase/dehydratase domain-containing protein n=1 Tax=Agrocybe pediades TaxID=84607 RepID=A0A8H4QFT5_9AGAR|nr:hypothetical protein D9613_010419 [Agrocybe pediades]